MVIPPSSIKGGAPSGGQPHAFFYFGDGGACDGPRPLGPRPEHVREVRGHEPEMATIEPVLDVVEPMGMETIVYFTVNGAEVCGRVAPEAASGPGQPMRLAVDMNQMHLIDPRSDAVL